MRTLEKVNTVRENVNCTYEEARKALLICYGNITEAIRFLEDKSRMKAKQQETL